MDKDRKKILDRRAKGRAEALGKDKGKLSANYWIIFYIISYVLQYGQQCRGS